MEYRVTWVIDLDAESFEDVARLARDPTGPRLPRHAIHRPGS